LIVNIRSSTLRSVQVDADPTSQIKNDRLTHYRYQPSHYY